ncbi:MAG: thiazole biosynthesis adenylyltransferase ThiF [Fuerstiella sp.]|nr:thiazole biosynthesis adenylyltransferase ThiF [Fuerstiella sp.]
MDNARYQKQILFTEIGEAGQQVLQRSRVLLVGCGALGCVLADAMTRAGVGHLRIVDRDFVELSNLQRQMLFTEDDVAAHLPKAVCAADRLRRVNSSINIEPVVADVEFTNIRGFAADVDLILDGTDNFEVRYLINDLSLDTGIPWIFTGCTGSHGQMMPVFPGQSACLRCLMTNPPPPGTTETCDTAGVLGPAISVIASLQAATALKILVQRSQTSGSTTCDVPLKLTIVDVWRGTFRQMDVSKLRESSECPACKGGERLWLEGSQTSGSTILCGRNAVQVMPVEKLRLSPGELAKRLESVGSVTCNPFLVRVALAESELELTVFPDGRTIVKGTEDPAIARAAYCRYIGT